MLHSINWQSKIWLKKIMELRPEPSYLFCSLLTHFSYVDRNRELKHCEGEFEAADGDQGWLLWEPWRGKSAKTLSLSLNYSVQCGFLLSRPALGHRREKMIKLVFSLHRFPLLTSSSRELTLIVLVSIVNFNSAMMPIFQPCIPDDTDINLISDSTYFCYYFVVLEC